MPSFDVVSEVDTHELTNAIDQANRELATRFDFKGVDAKFERDGDVINQFAPTEFQLKQMNDILRARLAARGIDVLSLEFGDIETNLAQARQKITVKQGIEQKVAKKIAAALKEAKLLKARSMATSCACRARSAMTCRTPSPCSRPASSSCRCSSTISAIDLAAGHGPAPAPGTTARCKRRAYNPPRQPTCPP